MLNHGTCSRQRVTRGMRQPNPQESPARIGISYFEGMMALETMNVARPEGLEPPTPWFEGGGLEI